MSSSEASSSIPFRSKKPLNPIPKAQALDLNPLSSKTPEKPPELPRRARNLNVALSLKEVRKAAESLRESNRKNSRDGTDQISSARRKIAPRPEETLAPRSQNDASTASKLPEKYEILSEFFNSLDNSIRLLQLKGLTTNFSNIRPKIEYLTDRRFTYSHLAQMKFILPEVIEIKKTLIFNERTSCMKPDLHISMNLEAIDQDGKLESESANIYLRRVFHSRLTDFSRSHPKGHEIPEETLPVLFNRLKEDVPSDLTKVSEAQSADQALGEINEEMKPVPSTNLRKQDVNSNQNKNEQPVVATHLSHSFRRRFSQKPKSNEVENTAQKPPELPSQSPGHSFAHSSFNTDSSNEETSSVQDFGPLNGTPSKELSTLKNEKSTPIKCSSFQSTPAKLASTPVRLMTATPGLCPPKRSYMSPEDDSTGSPNKLIRRPPRTRSLKFDSPVKNNKVKDEALDIDNAPIDGEILDILPGNLLQSIKEKERKAIEEQDPAISQAKRRQRMIACLPKLFNMIHFLFQSINRSVITKEELMHKIISSHSDIIDKREVEEQLSLLLELVPDWISEKLASSGDLLLRINKTSSPMSIRERLEEAK